MKPSRLGVSNLAWTAEHEAIALDTLVKHGAHGVEVAPTRIAPWPELTAERLAKFRMACEQRGLAVSSLQAIFYGVPSAALLADAPAFAAMTEQVRHVGAVAHALGTTIAVFGAPKSRLRGALSADAAMDLATNRLAKLGDVAAEHGLRLGMEAVPSYYGSDFLTHASDVVEIVKRCAHPNIAAHVDIACSTLAGCDPADAIRMARPIHYHIAEPDLAPLRTPSCDHAGAAAALLETNYAGWLVIEMREHPVDDVAAICDSIDFARQVYTICPPITA